MSKRLKSASVFSDNSFPLACLRIDDHKACGIHCHEFHEIVVILTGHGRHITDREEYPIEAGDVFLLRDNMAHGYADTDRMTLVNILFDPKRLALPMDYLRDLPGYHALFKVEPRLRTFNRFRNRLHLPEENLAEAAGIIARLQQELERKTPGYRFQANAHLMSLIAFVSRCYSLSDRQMDRPLLRMGEVLSYIEQHYVDPITVQQLMRIAHMSESSLMRTFRRVLKRSPIEQDVGVRAQLSIPLKKSGSTRGTRRGDARSEAPELDRQWRYVKTTA